MKVLNKHGKLNKTFFVGATVSSLTFYKVQQQKYKLTLYQLTNISLLLERVGGLLIHKTFIQTAKIQTHRCIIQCKKTAIKLTVSLGWPSVVPAPKPTGCLMV